VSKTPTGKVGLGFIGGGIITQPTTMTMTVNNKAVKGCSGFPLLTELPRGLIFSEICSQDYSGKDREFTSCVAPLSRVGSLAITGLVPQGAPQLLSRPRAGGGGEGGG
jgi:hypothetical protein